MLIDLFSVLVRLHADVEDCLRIMDPGILSLNDLCGIRTGIYVKNLKKQIEIATEHIMQCEVTDLILLFAGLNFLHPWQRL